MQKWPKLSVRHRSHGMYKTHTHNVWRGMMARCYNINNPDYEIYGGMGVCVIPSWQTFAGFYKYWGIIPAELQIDRKDGKGNYEPANCQLSTNAQNCAVGRRRIRSDNKSGVTGVSFWHEKKLWLASGILAGRPLPLYKGPSFEEAVMARKKWEEENVKN